MTYEEIEDTESSLRFKKENYLEKRGWERTCNLPGSFWYWEREYDNKNIIMPLDCAVTLQSHIDEK